MRDNINKYKKHLKNTPISRDGRTKSKNTRVVGSSQDASLHFFS